MFASSFGKSKDSRFRQLPKAVNIRHKARTLSGSVNQRYDPHQMASPLHAQLSSNKDYARAFDNITLSSWLYFNIRIGPSVRRFSASVKVLELSGKRFSDRRSIYFLLWTLVHMCKIAKRSSVVEYVFASSQKPRTHDNYSSGTPGGKTSWWTSARTSRRLCKCKYKYMQPGLTAFISNIVFIISLDIVIWIRIQQCD